MLELLPEASIRRTFLNFLAQIYSFVEHGFSNVNISKNSRTPN